jgi:hypothetical protein
MVEVRNSGKIGQLRSKGGRKRTPYPRVLVWATKAKENAMIAAVCLKEFIDAYWGGRSVSFRQEIQRQLQCPFLF